MAKAKGKVVKRDDTKEDAKFQKNSGKGRSGKPRPESKSAKSDFICSAGRPTNDPRWYLNNPYLSRDVGSLWFSKPVGTRLVHSAIVSGGVPASPNDTYEPGILSIPTIPTWGGTTSNGIGAGVVNNALNLTAQKLYQFVVHANSRNISYDKKDLIMSMMAIDSIYMVITEAIRAYRLTASYDPQNKYVTRLLETMHWDPDDLRSHVAQFRYSINWAISRVNKFFMPALFDIVKAHMSCYEHVYTDRPSNKAQFIVKWMPGAWVYDDVEGCLQFCKKWQKLNSLSQVAYYDPNTLRTVATFHDVISDMIARVENSQYIGVMQGDLLKAFGMERMSQYAYAGIDMPIMPIYDEEFLLKLHNADLSMTNPASMFATHGTYDTYMIYRDTDVVDGNIRSLRVGRLTPTDFPSVRVAEGAMIDLPTTIPATPDNIMLMNLYKLADDYSTSTKWYLSDTNPGTYVEGFVAPEIMLTASLYYDPEDLTKVTAIHTWAMALYNVGLISRFRMHPLMTEEVATDGMQHAVLWETDNVTSIEYRQILKIFDVVFWSLWSSSEISSSEEVRDSRI